MSEPLIVEKSVAGRKGYSLPDLDVPEVPIAELILPFGRIWMPIQPRRATFAIRMVAWTPTGQTTLSTMRM